MKTKVIRCLLFCWLVLSGTACAQETVDGQAKARAEAQEKIKAERAIELERQAAARAAAEHSRAADRALQVQRRAAAKAAAETRRAVMKAYHQQRRAMQRSAAEVNRMQLRMRRAADEMRRVEGTFKFVSSRPTIDIKKTVKRAPYSAKAITEHTQTLSDGNQIIHRNEALYYRDNEGRLRIEQSLKTIGKWAAQDEPAKIITIYDPVAGSYYSLNPDTRVALQDPSGTLRMKMREYQKIEAEYVEKIKLMNEMKTKMSDSPKDKEKSVDSPKKITPQEQSDSRRKKESLGKQTIEGVVAEGTRTTRTIPAGEIGNVRPIEIIDEKWYSPELQLHVLTKHQDPRSGETVYRLSNINRSEPDRSLFEVPSDYRIVDKFSYRSPKKVEATKVP